MTSNHEVYMTNIIFNHPPCKSKNPLRDFVPSDANNYPEGNGVYIYGIRVKVDNQLKFVPLIVGEGQLKKRLYKDHYLKKFKNPLDSLTGTSKKKGGDPKELWDFSNLEKTKTELIYMYKQMGQYDHKSSKKNMNKLSKLKHLIFFQNAEFYHSKLKFPNPPIKLDLTKPEKSVIYLLELQQKYGIDKQITFLISKILLTFYNFSRQFYYVYAKIEQSASEESDNEFSKKLKCIEFEVKELLKQKGIHTTAAANAGNCKSIFSINFDKVKDCFVDLTE